LLDRELAAADRAIDLAFLVGHERPHALIILFEHVGQMIGQRRAVVEVRRIEFLFRFFAELFAKHG